MFIRSPYENHLRSSGIIRNNLMRRFLPGIRNIVSKGIGDQQQII